MLTQPHMPESFLCRTCNGAVPLLLKEEGIPVTCPGCARVYAWDDGILVYDATANTEDYPDESYGLLAAVEPRHFWFRARNRIILSALGETLGDLKGRSVLDVGCGTGYVLQGLERAGMVCCGLDMFIGGLRYARQRTRALLLQADAGRLPFARQFDLVALCDVIEHVEDDVAVLESAKEALRSPGFIVITVPGPPVALDLAGRIVGSQTALR